MPQETFGTNQHYVPQLLLRAFLSEDGPIYVFDKATSKIFPQSPANIASECGFYDLDHSIVDQAIGRLEVMAAPIIANIRQVESLRNLDQQNQVVLAFFIALQYVRTKAHLERQKDFGKQLTNFAKELGLPQSAFSLTAEELRSEFLVSIFQHAQTITPYLVIGKRWALLRTTRLSPFWISDSPVTIANTLNPGDGVRGTLGFGVAGIEVYLPISPTLTLAIYCDSVVAHLEQDVQQASRFGLIAYRQEELLQALESGRASRVIAENVTFQNALQVNFAERFLYSPVPDFQLAIEMISEGSHFREGVRYGRPRT